MEASWVVLRRRLIAYIAGRAQSDMRRAMVPARVADLGQHDAMREDERVENDTSKVPSDVAVWTLLINVCNPLQTTRFG